MPKKARRFGRETKLAAVRRMLAGENVRALSRELNILRKDLYLWRAKFLAGGPEALRGPGRPPSIRDTGSPDASLVEPRSALTNAHKRIAELERKVGRQQKELEAIRRALQAKGKRRSGERSGT
jgi:transposase-like protein